MPKEYRWLLIITCINALLLFTYLCLVMYSFWLYLQEGSFNLSNLVSMIIMMAMFLQSLFVVNLCKKHYPDKEIPGAQLQWLNIIQVFSWIGLVLFYLITLGIIFTMVTSDLYFEDITRPIIAFCFISFTVLMTFQLIGTKSLIKEINYNARQLLENSFD